jgi:signal transduction histidine kinase
MTLEAPDALDARLAALDGVEGEARVDALVDLADALRTREPERQLALADEARARAERLGYARGRARALGAAGRAYYFLSDYDAALPLLTEALTYFDGEGDAEGARPFRGMLPRLYAGLGQYEEALRLALAQLAEARARGDREVAAWILQGLSAAYLELGDPDRALGHAMESLDAFTKLGDAIGQARAHSAVGTVLRMLGRHAEAEGHHDVSLQLFRQVGDRLGEARALHDLGALALERGDPACALRFHEQALELRRRIQNRQSETTSLLALGETLLALGRTDDALATLHEALALAERLALQPRVFQTHRALAEAYERAGDAARALHHYKRYHQVCERVVGAETSGRLQTLQIRHDAERAQQEAELAQQERELAHLRNVELREKNEQLEKLLTELKRTQARLVQSEKLAGLGRLTAGIAHEIKNPLNFIVNFAQLNAELADDVRVAFDARRAELPPDLAGDLDDDLATLAANAGRVLEHARRADGIVRSMLGHVRVAGGEHQDVALHALLDQTVEAVFGGRDGDGGVAVARDYDGEVTTLKAAPQALGRVFANLLENARYAVRRHAEAAGDGYCPQVEVKTRALPGLVQVRVVDNGPGVPAEHCSRLFEPFFTTKPPGEGTGLGLSLAYEIVTQGHGGSLAVHSREGEGATFVVTLPAGEG